MIGYIEDYVPSTKFPYRSAIERPFLREEVAALGKLRCWGSAGVNFRIRLKDGTLLGIRACDQPKDDEKWLRKLAKKVPYVDPGRYWSTAWVEVE